MSAGPLETEVADSLAVLAQARLAGDHEMADAVECDLRSALRLLSKSQLRGPLLAQLLN